MPNLNDKLIQSLTPNEEPFTVPAPQLTEEEIKAAEELRQEIVSEGAKAAMQMLIKTFRWANLKSNIEYSGTDEATGETFVLFFRKSNIVKL